MAKSLYYNILWNDNACLLTDVAAFSARVNIYSFTFFVNIIIYQYRKLVQLIII